MFRVKLIALLPLLLLAHVHVVTSTAMAGGTAPMGVHLAFARTDDGMTVTFHAFQTTNRPVVECRALGSSEVLHTEGTTRAFVVGGDEQVARYMYHTALTGLTQGTAYAYRGRGGSRRRSV